MEHADPILCFVSQLNLIHILMLIWVPYGIFAAVRKLKNSSLSFFDRTVLVACACATVAFLLFLMSVSATFSTKEEPEFAITGQLLVSSPSGADAHPIAGANVYLFPAHVTDKTQYWNKLFMDSEVGIIARDQSTRESERCFEEFKSIVKQSVGLQGPLDVKFYPIKALWRRIKEHPNFLALSAQMQHDFREEFWREKVASDPQFSRLTPKQLSAYNAALFLGDDWSGAVQERLQHLPYVVSDSRGEFSAQVRSGTYILVASGREPSADVTYVWTVPVNVAGDTRLVTDDVVCQGTAF